MDYLKNICTALSELGNIILGGYQHETICARIYRQYQNTLLHKFVDILFFDKKHCRKAYLRNALRNEGKNIKGIC